MKCDRSVMPAPGPRPGATRPARGQRIAAALLSAAAIYLGATGVASAGAIVNDAGCTMNSMPHNDDGASPSVPIGFNVNLNGSFYPDLYIDTNGYVMFGTPPPTFFNYNSLRLDTTSQRLIAPFLTDVDTSNAASGLVTYGPTTFGANQAFCVNWGGPLSVAGTTGVGYYNAKADMLNRFQLLLVERADRAAGDFDIIFNYDEILWDLPDDCLSGGCMPFAGFAIGAAGPPQLLPGSGTLGTLLDSNPILGLVHNGLGTPTLGRYIFAISSGQPPAQATLSGTVYGPDGQPLAGALVQGIPLNGDPPVMSVTNALGHYILTGFDGLSLNSTYGVNVTAYAPSGIDFIQTTAGPVLVDNGSTPVQDITLGAALGIPANTSLSPSASGGAGVPTVFWGNPLALTTQGCPNATASSYAITQSTNGAPVTVGGGSLTETPAGSGAYSATVPPFHPVHGYATVTLSLTCPGGSTLSSAFNIYIDPSGKVHNTHGAPIEGATATLFRSDGPFGPFDPVPDGSAIMSPSNRDNPSFTDTTGFFGWDVIAGYYIVRAEKAGCTSPLDPMLPYVETDVMRVPEEVTGLDLILNCDAVPPPVIETPGDLTAEATSSAGAVVAYTTFASDGAGSPVGVTCAPASGSTFPLGTTAVFCGATNSAGNSASASFNVTVVDTASPILSLPAATTVFATSTKGNNVVYAASASDLVDGAITPACSPISGSRFRVGSTSVACFAADTEGNAASGSFQVNVVYESLAILPPIDPNGTSTFEQWYDIPVNFTLGGASRGVTNVEARLFVAPVQGGVVGPEVPALPSGHANRGNLFKFRLADGAYHYLLSTDTLAPGVYRFRIDLGDGVPYTTLITLNKH
jgi:HYR domain